MSRVARHIESRIYAAQARQYGWLFRDFLPGDGPTSDIASGTNKCLQAAAGSRKIPDNVWNRVTTLRTHYLGLRPAPDRSEKAFCKFVRPVPLTGSQ